MDSLTDARNLDRIQERILADGNKSTTDMEEDTILEEQTIDTQIQKDYRIWKKNSPFLYDYLSTNTLLWPSLTVQFFPDLGKPSPTETGDQVSQQRLLLGTFTLGQSIDSISIVQHSYYQDLNQDLKINRLDYIQDKQEFELSVPSVSKLKVLQKINHYGDVNKVQFMPQKPNVLASANSHGDLVIYERTKHSNFQSDLTSSSANKVQLTLKGKSSTASEAFALDWNRQKEGTLVAANVTGDINVFDIKNNFSSDTTTLSQSQYFANETGVNDIEWFPNHDSLFAAVDEAGDAKVYDTRLEQPVVSSFRVGACGVNSVSVNKQVPLILAAGDSEGTIKVWDMRSNEATKSIQAHKEAITQLKWHRTFGGILGSTSSDSTMKLHNTTKEDTLMFVHSGHMLGVNDFDWSCHDDWMVASVADDNSLHVWKPNHEVQRSI